MIFELRAAESLADAEAMRIVRNECREFMTRSPLEISRDDQISWFQALDRATATPFIGVAGSKAFPMAYGLIRLIDNKWWLSGGVRTNWRGVGYGRLLFVELTKRVHAMRRDAWLEVRKDNERAIRLYQLLGFSYANEDEHVYTMRKGFL